ncbi:MAG: hypothetical protein II998_07005 [Clostridia bacterium]|nr:hypothetical protein [Clostridia bacterium]
MLCERVKFYKEKISLFLLLTLLCTMLVFVNVIAATYPYTIDFENGELENTYDKNYSANLTRSNLICGNDEYNSYGFISHTGTSEREAFALQNQIGSSSAYNGKLIFNFDFIMLRNSGGMVIRLGNSTNNLITIKSNGDVLAGSTTIGKIEENKMYHMTVHINQTIKPGATNSCEGQNAYMKCTVSGEGYYVYGEGVMLCSTKGAHVSQLVVKVINSDVCFDNLTLNTGTAFSLDDFVKLKLNDDKISADYDIEAGSDGSLAVVAARFDKITNRLLSALCKQCEVNDGYFNVTFEMPAITGDNEEIRIFYLDGLKSMNVLRPERIITPVVTWDPATYTTDVE